MIMLYEFVDKFCFMLIHRTLFILWGSLAVSQGCSFLGTLVVCLN